MDAVMRDASMARLMSSSSFDTLFCKSQSNTCLQAQSNTYGTGKRHHCRLSLFILVTRSI